MSEYVERNKDKTYKCGEEIARVSGFYRSAEIDFHCVECTHFSPEECKALNYILMVGVKA